MDEHPGTAAGRLAICLHHDHTEALVAAYFDPANGFAADTFDALGDNPPTTFVRDDLLALTCLDERVPPAGIRWLLCTEGQKAISPLLAKVPPEAVLGSDGDQEALVAAQAVWEALQDQDGIGPTKAGKLLARKRPHLVPIVDSVVGTVVNAKPGTYWATYRAFMSDPTNVSTLGDLRTAAGSPPVSLLRVLDVAVWMLGSRSERAYLARTRLGVEDLPWAPRPDSAKTS